MKYLEHVVTLQLDRNKCVGCGRCLEVCPHGVFNLAGDKTIIVDRDACMECGACARNCPAGALYVKNGVGCAVGILNAKLGRTSSCCGGEQACCCSCEEENKGEVNRVRKLKILFLCTGNSCRSQMAEGWARALKGDVIEAYSAGIETHGLNPNAVRVMAEAGVDISGQVSKNVDTLLEVPFDYVVTVCGHANENCPFFPGPAKVVHVGFDDPPALAKLAESEEAKLNCYRRVRDEIRAFVERLPETLENK